MRSLGIGSRRLYSLWLQNIGPGLTGQGMSLALLRYALAFIHPEQFDYDRRHLRGAVHNPKRGAAGDAEELVGIVRV